MAERMAQPRVRLPADQGRSVVGLVKSENHAHRRRLSRPVRADETGHAPRRDRERHAVESRRAAEPLAQILTSIVASSRNGRTRGLCCRRAREPSSPSPRAGTEPPRPSPGDAHVAGAGDATAAPSHDNGIVTDIAHRSPPAWHSLHSPSPSRSRAPPYRSQYPGNARTRLPRSRDNATACSCPRRAPPRRSPLQACSRPQSSFTP